MSNSLRIISGTVITIGNTTGFVTYVVGGYIYFSTDGIICRVPESDSRVNFINATGNCECFDPPSSPTEDNSCLWLDGLPHLWLDLSPAVFI